jgi:hypothetical protein
MMRRLLLLVTVALVMAAMMAVFSTSAMAEQPGNSNCSAAAVNPKEPLFQPNLGLFTSSFIAEQGHQTFSAFVVSTSTICRQG